MRVLDIETAKLLKMFKCRIEIISRHRDGKYFEYSNIYIGDHDYINHMSIVDIKTCKEKRIINVERHHYSFESKVFEKLMNSNFLLRVIS